MIRVLHVVPSLAPAGGGPTFAVTGLCAAEAEAGAKVSLVAFGDEDHDIEGVDSIIVRPLPGTRQGVTPTFVKTMTAAAARADVVHVHSLWNPPTSIAQSIAGRRGVPYVISPHGMLQQVSLTRKAALKRLAGVLGERKKITAARGIRWLSEGERLASAAFPHLPERSVVVPNGIDPELRSSVASGSFRARHPELHDMKIVLFVGRLHWSKDLSVQLEAFSGLARQRSDIAWVLIGPDEGEWTELSNESKRRGLSNMVWLGARSRRESLEALRDCDAVWLTSRHEAHSMVMNEALILGAPLVITDSVGFSSLGDLGAALVVPSTPDAVASGVGRILDEPGLAARLAEQGMRFAADNLGWPRVARSMLHFYDEILSSNRSSGAR